MIGLLVLVVFVRRSLHVSNPALDLRLFRDRSFRWANIATAAFTIGFTAMFFANIQFTTQVWGYGIVRAGLAMVPGPMVVVILAPQMGRLAARFGQRSLLARCLRSHRCLPLEIPGPVWPRLVPAVVHSPPAVPPPIPPLR